MEGPITAAAGSPAMAALLQQIAALMPAGTALYIVAVGPSGDTHLREVALGGPLDDADALRIAAQVLAGRGRTIGEIAVKSRMH